MKPEKRLRGGREMDDWYKDKPMDGWMEFLNNEKK